MCWVVVVVVVDAADDAVVVVELLFRLLLLVFDVGVDVENVVCFWYSVVCVVVVGWC